MFQLRMCFLSLMAKTNKHWNSCCSLKRLSVRIEGFQAEQHHSHLLHSECVSASLTVTALTVNYTVTANCLLYWKQGCLWAQYADGTQIIEVSLSLMVQERRKESLKENNETERKKWHHSDSEISISSVGLDAGVCLISKAVLSLSLFYTLNKEKHMHAQTHNCTNGLCSLVKMNGWMLH